MKILNTVGDKKQKVVGSKLKKQNTIKDKAILRKKLLKVLKSKDVSSSGGDSEEDSYMENYAKSNAINWQPIPENKKNVQISKVSKKSESEEEIMRKTKKKLIKNKETLQQENEMVNVISDIISSKQKNLLSKMLDLPFRDKLKMKKSKLETKNSDAFISVLDPIRSVATKNKTKADKKEVVKKVKSPSEPSTTLKFLENCDSKRAKRKLSQNINYKRSVMEIFDSGKLKGAVIKTPHFNLDLPKNNLTELTTSTLNADMIVDGENGDECVSNCTENVDNKSQCIAEYEPTNVKSTPSPLQVKSTKYKICTFPKCSVLIMKQNTSLYFCGKLKATLLRGNVDVLGHTMNSIAQEIYSLPIASLLYFHSHQHKDKQLDIAKLLNFDISEQDCEIVLENVGPSDSVLLLQPYTNIMTEFVSKHFPYFNVFVKEKFDDTEDVEAFKLLQCHFFTDARKGILKLNLLSSPITNNLLNKINTSSKSITMLCGGKNTGKSTFLRYLINKCVAVTPVLVLDLDPGQPEFTVCGLLSATVVSQPILGPNFTHLMTPDRSLALGFINMSENENRYMACVQDLFKYCSAHGKYSHMPWIINTSGFTGPIGLKLAAFIMNIIQPSMVIELISNVKRLNFEIQLESRNINEYQKNIEFTVDDISIEKVSQDYDYYNLDPFNYQWTSSKPSLCRNVEPRDERMLNLLAYFSQISNTDLSILQDPPYVISMNDITLAFNNVCVDEKCLHSIVNAKMVALCHDDNVEDSNKTLVNIGLFSCYGYGIVRGIDYDQKKIFITTPVKPSLISFVNMLVYGESLPECSSMSTESLAQGTFVPYTMPFVDSDFNKQLMKTPKRKFNPFRLLEIRSKS